MKERAKPWYKRWWAITLYVVIGLVILSSILSSSNEQGTQETGLPESMPSSKQATAKDFNGDLATLLPTGDDIPSEFRRGEVETIDTKIYNHTGADKSKRVSHIKLKNSYGSSYVNMEFQAFQFSTVTAALESFNRWVGETKNAGGYKEVDSGDLSVKCFTIFEDQGFSQRIAFSRCISQNIIFTTEVISVSTLESPTDLLEDMNTIYGRKVIAATS